MTTARVFAAALRNWTRIGGQTDAATAVRVDVRQPADWSHIATINIDRQQANRVLGLLRHDVADQIPGPRAPEQAALLIDARLTELRAAGHRTIRPTDLLDLAHTTGQTKEWLAAHLSHLADTGRLRETRWRTGIYRITTPPAPWAIRPGMPTAR
ncbi:hypothetical protein [Streptomyces sp. NBC_01803]|uniref:hypothetical protein n=1 Tax=Streptomyces sp. NBC_01803 TaxID=2975946 RepID=UPI002DDC14C9|nr:hypothetical protein [Streptomyces sp. NBC_01803]WSA45308.1 hypothetical protein OIE51_14480 [Streptomyces sp. NBC_01803]